MFDYRPVWIDGASAFSHSLARDRAYMADDHVQQKQQ